MSTPVKPGAVTALCTEHFEEDVDRFVYAVTRPLSIFGMFSSLLIVVLIILLNIAYQLSPCSLSVLLCIPVVLGLVVLFDVAFFPRSKAFKLHLVNGTAGDFWTWHFSMFGKKKY
jgi:type IV secretory pathway VirB3-like protein